MMRHATAWPARYRNHYVAAPADAVLWDELVAMDLAICHGASDMTGGTPLYSVSAMGFIALTDNDKTPTEQLEADVQHALDGTMEVGEQRLIVHDEDGDVYGFGRWGRGSLTVICGYIDPGNKPALEEITISAPVMRQLLEWLVPTKEAGATVLHRRLPQHPPNPKS